MSEITNVRFVLAALDLKRSTDYYTSVLGLTIDFEVPGWSFLSRGSLRVMLGECADAIPPGELGDHSYYGYISVTDIDTLYGEYQIKADGCVAAQDHGPQVPDPKKLLLGSGKQTRFFLVESASQLAHPDLEAFMVAAMGREAEMRMLPFPPCCAL